MTLGIGIDLVDVQRFRKVLQRREKIGSRLFTDDELSRTTNFPTATQSLTLRSEWPFASPLKKQ